MRYLCPVCKENLIKADLNYKCENGHNFDCAKQGYINLLIPDGKRSKIPGDNKDMVLARKKFLEKNYYSKVSKVINEYIKDITKHKHIGRIIDVGCGEGYYTERVRKEFENKFEVVGLDISKIAIKEAAKEYKKIEFVVASSQKMPFEDNYFDVSLNIFTRLMKDENYRILNNEAFLIVVSAGKKHLLELREIIYEDVIIDSFSPQKELEDRFDLIESKNVKDELLITKNEDIVNLFNMTPYKWRSPKSRVDKLLKMDNLELTLDVKIDIFTKK